VFLLFLGTVYGVPGGVPFLEVKTPAGFFCDLGGTFGARSARIREALQGFMAVFKPCPFSRGGETCTVLPFFCNANRGSNLAYHRVWIKSPDGESFAADWTFPPSGFDPDRPVVLLLTGLAPRKHWTQAGGFVADAAWHLTAISGMTVVVVVSRGTQDTQVQEHMFHGARTEDLRQVVLLAHETLEAACGKPPSVFA
ncbi:unnamed protein product, partial [Polarella glacialis]